MGASAGAASGGAASGGASSGGAPSACASPLAPSSETTTRIPSPSEILVMGSVVSRRAPPRQCRCRPGEPIPAWRHARPGFARSGRCVVRDAPGTHDRRARRARARAGDGSLPELRLRVRAALRDRPFDGARRVRAGAGAVRLRARDAEAACGPSLDACCDAHTHTCIDAHTELRRARHRSRDLGTRLLWTECRPDHVGGHAVRRGADR